MIEKDHETGIYCVYCDAKRCLNSQEYDTFESWKELLNKMKQDGWVSIKMGNMWKNVCIDCSARLKKRRAKK